MKPLFYWNRFTDMILPWVCMGSLFVIGYYTYIDHTVKIQNETLKCEKTVSDGDVKYGEPELYQFHVNTSVYKVCKDVSDAFGLEQDDMCLHETTKGDNDSINIDMSKGHYVCVTNSRWNGHNHYGQYCFDLYEMTER